MVQSPLQRENLIKQVSTEAITRPSGFYKSILLDALAIAAAFAFGWSLQLFFRNALPSWAVLIAVTFFALFSTFEVFLVKGFGRRFFVILLEVVAVAGLFYAEALKFLIPAAVLLFVFLVWGEIAARRELENNLEIRFFKMSGLFLKKFMTAVVFFMVILYLPRWNPDSLFFSRRSYDVMFAWAMGIANGFYPEIDFHSTLQNLATSVVRSQFRGAPGFANLSPLEQEKAMAQGASDLLKKLGESIGIAVKPDNTLGDVVYGAITHTLEGWHREYGDWFLAGWAILLFFVLRGLSAIFYPLVAFIEFTLYELCIALNLIHIAGESRTHEVVEFS